MSIFEQASRVKLRFDCAKGYLSHEDLWALDLKDLDDIAVGLHRQLGHDNVSFISTQKPDPLMQLRFDVAKHIIDTRVEESAKRQTEQARAEKKQRVLAIMARKEEADLEGKSMDELRELMAEL